MFAKYSLLAPSECDAIVADLDRLPWAGGLAPGQSYRDKVKRNKEIALQMSPDTAVADEHLRLITSKILASQFLKERILGKSLVNPRFNLYEGAPSTASMPIQRSWAGRRGRSERISPQPCSYVTRQATTAGTRARLSFRSDRLDQGAAGHAGVLSVGVMHQVTPVTRGRRIAFVAWIESHIQNPQMRDILTEITALCEELNATNLALGELHMRAINIKHNLFRIWWKHEE